MFYRFLEKIATRSTYGTLLDCTLQFPNTYGIPIYYYSTCFITVRCDVLVCTLHLRLVRYSLKLFTDMKAMYPSNIFFQHLTKCDSNNET